MLLLEGSYSLKIVQYNIFLNLFKDFFDIQGE